MNWLETDNAAARAPTATDRISEIAITALNWNAVTPASRATWERAFATSCETPSRSLTSSLDPLPSSPDNEFASTVMRSEDLSSVSIASKFGTTWRRRVLGISLPSARSHTSWRLTVGTGGRCRAALTQQRCDRGSCNARTRNMCQSNARTPAMTGKSGCRNARAFKSTWIPFAVRSSSETRDPEIGSSRLERHFARFKPP